MAKAKTPATQTWTVTLDGAPVQITAEEFEITEIGGLTFFSAGNITLAVAPGHWTDVRLLPAPDDNPVE